MWFKAEYTDSEGNNFKKRSNDEIYEDIYESIDDDYAPMNTFLDYEASYKEWIKRTYEKGGLDILMKELEKYDYLTERDEYMSIPFSVCSQFMEQFIGDELLSSNISLIEFPDCWKICQKGYHSERFFYEGMQSNDIMEINGSEKNPGEYLRRFVEATLEGTFWDRFNEELEIDGIDNLVLWNFIDLGEGEKFDFDHYIGFTSPYPLKFPKKLKKEAFNKLIEDLKGDCEDKETEKKYVKKLKEQIDLLK
jgi:hypothetical protein